MNAGDRHPANSLTQSGKPVHPDEMELALYASRDLSMWRNWQIGRHVKSCPNCAREIGALSRSRATLHESGSEMPPDVHWGRLSAEMRANIKLGLAVGAIAGPPPETVQPMGWRVAAAVACTVVLVIGGWWLHMPQPALVSPGSGLRSSLYPGQTQQPVLLKTTRSGIELEDNGHSMALVHHGSDRATLSVGMRGDLQARYVDEDTGEVTIHHVYAE